MIYLARWLGPKQYGLLPIITSIITFFLIPADFGLNRSTSKFIAQYITEDKGKVSRVFRDGLLFKIIFGIFVSCICIILSKPLSLFLNESGLRILFPLAAASIFLTNLTTFGEKVFQGLRRLEFVPINYFIESGVISICSLCLVYAGSGAIGAMWGRVIGLTTSLIVLLIIFFALFHKQHRKLHQSFIKEIFRYSLPMIVVTTSAYLYLQSSIFMIGYFYNSSFAAYYSIPMQFISKFQFPAFAFGAAICPIFSALKEDDIHRISYLYHKSIKFTLVFILPFTLGLLSLAHPFVVQILGEEYLPSVLVLRVGALFFFFGSLAGAVVGPSLDYLGVGAIRAKLAFICAVANIFMGLLLIPKYGIVGAAASVSLTYSCYALLLLRVVLRISHISILSFKSEIVKIGIPSLLMFIATILLSSFITNIFHLIIITLFSIIFYVSMLLILGGITKSEIIDLQKSFANIHF